MEMVRDMTKLPPDVIEVKCPTCNRIWMGAGKPEDSPVINGRCPLCALGTLDE